MRAKTEFLALWARSVALEGEAKRGIAEAIVYDDRTRAALGTYLGHLRDAGERLGERGRGLERELWGYGVGREREEGGDGNREGEKEKVMREVARVYGEMRRELGEVSTDVERLRGSR